MDELPPGFEYLGSYSPPEAKRFLEALEREDVPVHAEFHDGVASQSGLALVFGSFGGSAEVLIATPEAQRSIVSSIHSRLFGSGLPSESAAGAESEDWDPELAERELELLSRREGLLGQLAELDTELHHVLTEVAAVSAELKAGRQDEERLNALRQARERHLNRGAQIEGAKAALNNELQEVEQALYGENPTDSSQTTGGNAGPVPG